jgi:protein-tyrosine phosphatase
LIDRGDARPAGRASRPWSVLMVCTGNLCRSPMAERIAAGALASAGFGPAAALVTSAGTDAWDGEPMHPDARSALRGLGLDGTGFHARRLDPRHIAAADLVLCATLEHRAAVVRAVPVALRRTCALREFARAAALGPLPPPAPADDDAASALRTAGAALAARVLRHRTDGAATSAAEPADVVDPLGRGLAAFEACAATLAALLAEPLRLVTVAAAAGHRPPQPV